MNIRPYLMPVAAGLGLSLLTVQIGVWSLPLWWGLLLYLAYFASRPSLEGGELRAVINSMTEGLIIYTLEGQVVLINPALAQMLAPANPKASGRLIANPDDKLFFERAVAPAKLEAIWQATREEPEKPRSDLIELIAPHQVLKRYSAPWLGDDGRQLGHVVLYHDITAEAANEQMMADFIANASHELRTPVASIKVLVESLLEGAKDDPQLKDVFLKDLMREADRLHHLVDHLLDLSRYDAGGMVLEKRACQVAQVLQDAFETVAPLASQRGVELRRDVIGDVPAFFADAVRLNQVLVNLLTNAVKFTPAGGQVVVMVKKLPHAIEFQVRDSGIGIPAEDLPHIFDRFYRVDRARGAGGTGLGLTIVKNAVEAHGGSIFATSKPGQTIFTFTVPDEPSAARV